MHKIELARKCITARGSGSAWTPTARRRKGEEWIRRETDASRAEEETHGGHLPGSGDERMRGEAAVHKRSENENRERGKLWHYQF